MWKDDCTLDSAYSLIPMIRNPCINAGESFEIEVFLTGYGQGVKDNKFRISYSSPKLLKKDSKGKVGMLETCIKSIYKDGKLVSLLAGNKELNGQKAIEVSELDPVGTVGVLNEAYFHSIPGQKNIFAGDLMHDGHAPIFVKLNTSENAPSGDYKIFLTIFYSKNDEIKMDEKVIDVHINSWIEKHNKKLQAIAVTLGVLGLSAGVIQSIYTVLQYLK